MKKYKIEVTEMLQRVVEVEAPDSISAIDMVAGMYYQEDIVLTDEDLVNRSFEVYRN